jgi:glycosyltransferase involved in cell wall biosynthesis
MRDELVRRHGKPVTVLYSGFDPTEFAGMTVERTDGPRRLLFAGTLYGKQDLTPLLRTLADGSRDGWLRPGDVVVEFVGRLSDRAALEAERLGVAEFVRTSEPIPRADLLRRLVGADALLLPSLYETDRNALPMKLFEYVGAGRPIVVFGRGDHLAGRLVADNGLGVVLPDAPSVARCLRDLVAGTDSLPVADQAARARFGRDASLRPLGELVDDL